MGDTCEGVGVHVGEVWGGGEGEKRVKVFGGSVSCVEVTMGGVGEEEGEMVECGALI